MKTLLLVLCFNLCYGQCMEDIPRYAKYDLMEVFNHDTQQYEKYKKAEKVNIFVIINPETKTISFLDTLNKYNKKYTIVDCQMGKETLVYKCRDITNKKNCEFIFSSDKTLTVKYEPEPVIYRVKNATNEK